jgi:hypothetical protein
MNSNVSFNIRNCSIKSAAATLLDYSRHRILHLRLFNYMRDLRNERVLSKLHKSNLKALDVDGYVVLENYLSPKQCDEAANLLKASFKKFPQYVRASDDKRIFGVENCIPSALKLASEPLFEFFASQVNRERSSNMFTLGGWLQAGKGGSSGNGWHRDAFFSQFKAMLYLTDVSEKNGPFELLPGTHRLINLLSSTLTGGLRYKRDRISDEEVFHLEKVLKTPKRSIIGCAGTLVLFNSAVIHRGKPIEEGERLALTNYYFPISRDVNALLKQFSPVLTPDALI